uniref:Uncharacterized protein n=1 Tax=Rhizophora mucronata TaxID=61149 RepID=A0A2P2QRA0_RHIMU
MVPALLVLFRLILFNSDVNMDLLEEPVVRYPVYASAD